MFNLEGRKALVTGGSRGIGFAIAEELAKSKADVILVSRNSDNLEKAAKKLKPYGVIADYAVYDMTDLDGIESFYEHILQSYGRPDILINNAGGTKRGPAEQISLEDWNWVLTLNLTSVFRLSQLFAKELIRTSTKGKIVNTGSLMCDVVRENNAPYAASKGGLRQLTKSMAADWAKYNINVNASGPGFIRTDLSLVLQNDEEFNKRVLKRTPAARWGLPEDISGAAVFLCSDYANFVTGQILYVDGGITATF